LCAEATDLLLSEFESCMRPRVPCNHRATYCILCDAL